MQQLEQLKGKSITVPTKVKRYLIAFYKKANGWETYGEFFATPESALERFLNSYFVINSDKERPILYYQVIEVTLDIPL